jgi:membrane peptidoglycan carboxypeptidase
MRMQKPKTRRADYMRHGLTTLNLLFLAGLGLLVYGEIRTSWLQSQVLPSLARQLSYSVEGGPSPSAAYPTDGPYDRRLGYAHLPGFLERLEDRGFLIERQARLSDRHLAFIGRGGFAIYPEKTQAGLTLLDRHGDPLLAARYPARVYASFEAIPPIIIDTLLFIENRELLDPRHPGRNPAIEWDRLLGSGAALLAQLVQPTVSVAGGSTLATQMEKYRHASQGRTADAADKLRQMVSASLRAYRQGPDTTAARRRIVVDYLNSTPLSAQPGFGEVIGIGDGLLA